MSLRPKNLKKCMVMLNWNFQRGGEGGGLGLREKPFRGGGMVFLWNYTLHQLTITKLACEQAHLWVGYRWQRSWREEWGEEK